MIRKFLIGRFFYFFGENGVFERKTAFCRGDVGSPNEKIKKKRQQLLQNEGFLNFLPLFSV
jgi:hypothetical protein